MTTAFERRTRRCQEALSDAGAEAAVLFPSPNFYYLTGASSHPSERHLLLCVPADGEPAILVPELEATGLRRATWIDDLRLWPDEADPREHLETLLSDLGIGGGRVLLDDHMWTVFAQDIRMALPDASFGLAGEVLADLRVRKDERELEALRAAGEVADDVVVELRELGAGVVGMTEAELAWEIESRMREAGGGEPSFTPSVAAGPNGAVSHHRHSDRAIRAGEPVVLDFGCYLDHYPSDQTRTLVFAGDPPEGFEGAFEAVLEAHHAGVEAAGPGVPAQEVDRAARAVVEEAGYGDAFIHRTGHGVGLEIHEPPYIVEGNDRPLEEGMVFSVEPGVYLEGEFGVRVEDLVAVTEDGVERLNDSPRDFRVG